MALEKRNRLEATLVGALLAFATANGVVVDHWVPHGALYPMLARDETLANAMKISSGGPPVIMIAEEESFNF